MPNDIDIADERITGAQRAVIERKRDAGATVKLSYREVPFSHGLIVVTMHWQSGPNRLLQPVLPGGRLGPVSGFAPPRRGRR